MHTAIFARKNGMFQTNLKSIALMAMLVSAQAGLVQAQNTGHPLIKAYEGSVIEGQEVKEFDERLFVMGKVQPDGTVKTQKVEGRVTWIDYRDPDNRSSLERMRNYELALKKGGFEIVFSCNKEECGPEIQIEGIGFYPPERTLSAVLKRKEGNVWVGVFVKEGPWTKILVSEEKTMETGMVKVTAEVLTKNLLKEGHMALYGIYFDNGKSDLKPASAETIAMIAAFLQKNPALKIYIVGHTDNNGTLKDNMALSNRRAAAVVAELVTLHKIDALRLEAAGVGPLSPVASNDSDEGRGLNRRVEIVKK